MLADERITAGVGDFINVPRGTVHRFHNQSTETVRMISTFTPGSRTSFRKRCGRRWTRRPTARTMLTRSPPRYAAAAPRYGILFVTE